jgi:hypothetical protein
VRHPEIQGQRLGHPPRAFDIAGAALFAPFAKGAGFASFFFLEELTSARRPGESPPKRNNKFILVNESFTPSSFAIYFLSWHSANEVCDAEFERRWALLRALSASACQSRKGERDRGVIAREKLVNARRISNRHSAD